MTLLLACRHDGIVHSVFLISAAKLGYQVIIAILLLEKKYTHGQDYDHTSTAYLESAMTSVLTLALMLGFILGFLWLALSYWYVFAGLIAVGLFIVWMDS